MDDASTGTAQRPTTRPERRDRRGARWLWLFVAPALVPYLLIVLVPSVQGVWLSMTDWDGLSASSSFIGFDNFVGIVEDDVARQAILNTFIYALVTTVFENILGLLIALALHTHIKTRHALRVIFFVPVVLLSVVIAYLWQYLLQVNNGPINSTVQSLGFEGFDPNWLGNPDLVVFSISMIVVWQFTGYTMVIYLAGLQGVPQEQLEAASIDGAGPWTRFRYVIRPMLMPAITVNVMLSLIRGFMIFDQVWVTTGGGPADTSHSLSTLVYRTAFQFGQYGLGSALAVVLAVVVGAVAVVQYRNLLRGNR